MRHVSPLSVLYCTIIYCVCTISVFPFIQGSKKTEKKHHPAFCCIVYFWKLEFIGPPLYLYHYANTLYLMHHPAFYCNVQYVYFWKLEFIGSSPIYYFATTVLYST